MEIEVKQYLTSIQAPQLVGLSRAWLEKRRVYGNGPAYYKVSPRRVLYLEKDLIDWLGRHRMHSTSDPQGQAHKKNIEQGAKQ